MRARTAALAVLMLAQTSHGVAQTATPTPTRAIYSCSVSAGHFGGSDVVTSVMLELASGRAVWTHDVSSAPSAPGPGEHVRRTATLSTADRASLAAAVAAALAEHSPPSQPAIMDGEACSVRVVGTGEVTLLDVQRQTSPNADAVWTLIHALMTLRGLPFRG